MTGENPVLENMETIAELLDEGGFSPEVRNKFHVLRDDLNKVIDESETPTKQGDGPMMENIGNKIARKFFRRVNDVVWDLMSGKVGIRTKDGIATLEGKGDAAEVVVNMFDDFGVALPAFAQNTPVGEIKMGDLIYKDGKVGGWVVKTPTPKGKSFKLLKPDGSRGEWRPPKVASLGLDLSGAMVLRSLVNTLPDGGLGNMQSMLLPMMMMGGGDDMFGDMEDMLPVMLMMQCGLGGATPPADGGGMGGMMQTMMMMKMMGGGKKGDGSRRRPGGFFD